MRNKIARLILVLPLWVPLAATAQQTTESSRLSAGAEVGFAPATLSSYQSANLAEAFDTGFRNGLTIGAFLNVRLGDGVSIRPALHFVQKGAVLQFADEGGADSATVTLGYIELSTLIHLSPERNTIRPFINVGPAFARKTDARVDASASGGSPNVDVGSQVRDTDVGFAIGGGIQGFRWSVEARLVQGVTDIGDTPRVDNAIRTRTLSFIAGLKF
jgi:hypothetical protein